jgi:hypothetical protein
LRNAERHWQWAVIEWDFLTGKKEYFIRARHAFANVFDFSLTGPINRGNSPDEASDARTVFSSLPFVPERCRGT